MEQKLLFLINRQWITPALDVLMALMSSLDIWRVPLIVLAIVVAVMGGFRARTLLICLALGLAVSDGVVSASLKTLVNRPRPSDVSWDVRVVRFKKTNPRIAGLFQPVQASLAAPTAPPERGRSFPSSHVVNNFCAAMMIAYFYRRRGWLAFLPAGLVAWSRIYSGAHWPSDVLISIVLGTGLGLLLLAAFELAWRRWGARFFPRLHAQHPALTA